MSVPGWPGTPDEIGAVADVRAATKARMREYDWWRRQVYERLLIADVQSPEFTLLLQELNRLVSEELGEWRSGMLRCS